MGMHFNALQESKISSVAIAREDNDGAGPCLTIMYKQYQTRMISGPAIAKFVNETCVKDKNIIDPDSIDQIMQELRGFIIFENGQYRYTENQTTSTDLGCIITPNNLFEMSACRDDETFCTSAVDPKTTDTTLAGEHDPGAEDS